jgi:hypothetical protein
MPRPSTLHLPEPARVTEDPFWVMQVAGALPLALLLLGALDALRYAVAGPTPFERSIDVDILYATAFARLASWLAAGILAVLLYLSKAHASTTVKRRLWAGLLALIPVLLALVHWHTGAVEALLR